VYREVLVEPIILGFVINITVSNPIFNMPFPSAKTFIRDYIVLRMTVPDLDALMIPFSGGDEI
jgi:hypothetical protein